MGQYILNCFLLLLPILIWNTALSSKLPAIYADPDHQSKTLKLLNAVENMFRALVFLSIILMKISFEDKQQQMGLWIYLIGVLLYFLSWILQIKWPGSSWSRSMLGFLAPAYTPILWLAVIAMIGKENYFDLQFLTPLFIALSSLFILTHVIHNVYLHKLNKKGA